MKKLILLLLTLFSVNAFSQELKPLTYNVAEKTYTGYYASPKKISEKTKTILIVHEWWGLNAYPKERAKQLANEGFIAVCLDLYGTNVTADNPNDAGKLASELYQNPKLAYDIFTSGLNAAKKINGVQSDKIAAIGYCFGGNMVLNAAKMGAPIDAVVSFHGGLAGPAVDKQKLTAAVLICNGAADKFVPQTEIDNLISDFDKNGVNYKFINYVDAVHAFTNPNSTEVGKKFGIPIAYNEAADKKSYQDFMKFVKENVK